MAVDKSVNDLLALVKSTLSAEEIAWMSTPDSRNSEPDAYTSLQNHFTQKNTDAIVKCASLLSLYQLNLLVSILGLYLFMRSTLKYNVLYFYLCRS